MLIQINNLEKTFITGTQSLTILKDLNFQVTEVKSISIIGRSGSGKSTLLSIIAGYDIVTNGTVNVGGYNLSDRNISQKILSKYHSKFMGIVFQFHYLINGFSALDNVVLPALIAGESRHSATVRAKKLLEDVGLVDRINHLPTELSGGELQRVSLARALINRPRLILADEPTGNLDPTNSDKIGELLFNMARNYNATLLLVTHDNKLAQKADECWTILDKHLVKYEGNQSL